MKIVVLLVSIFTVLQLLSFGQIEKFNQHFTSGYYIANDGSRHNGLLKIYPTQYDNLKFKSGKNSKTAKLDPSDILQFTIDTTIFESLYSIEAIGAMGIRHTVKSCFAKSVDKGRINMYLIYFSDYNPISGSIQIFQNLVLIKSNRKQMVIPILQRVKKKLINETKEELKLFLGNQPMWNSKIEDIAKSNGMIETIDIVKAYNALSR